MAFLVHTDDEIVHELVEGVLYSLPPGEVCEVPDFHAKKIQEHKWAHGVVEVPVIKGKRGVSFDYDKAMELSETALMEADQKVLERYIETQQDRAKNNQAALPPDGRQVKVILRRKINLDHYGIRPVVVDPRILSSRGFSAIPKEIRDQGADAGKVAQLQAQVDKLAGMVQELLKVQAKGEPINLEVLAGMALVEEQGHGQGNAKAHTATQAGPDDDSGDGAGEDPELLGQDPDSLSTENIDLPNPSAGGMGVSLGHPATDETAEQGNSATIAIPARRTSAPPPKPIGRR